MSAVALGVLFLSSMAKTTTASRKTAKTTLVAQLPAGLTPQDVLRDYRIGVESREASLLGRREVLTGKAKFGIFGDGKELPQLAMARAFRHGDWRSGYYRDQTFMFAIGESTVQKFFAQLYAHTDVHAEPSSAGRSMNGHFGTRFLDEHGEWLSQTERYNVSADVSPTGSQMPRLVGLAYASVIYRGVDALSSQQGFSNGGAEVAFGTIGNASAAEGMFWEAVNAIGVLHAPAVISIWDDGYGISVPNAYQHTKGDVGALLEGFRRSPGSTDGYDIHRVDAYDYPALMATYAAASTTARTEHVPQLIHVVNVTQPQGHSTSGSHERYKSKERLAWEEEHDGLRKMRSWMLEMELVTEEQLVSIEEEAKTTVQQQRDAAWDAYISPIRADVAEATGMISAVHGTLQGSAADRVAAVLAELTSIREPFRRDIIRALYHTMLASAGTPSSERTRAIAWQKAYEDAIQPRYGSHLHSHSVHQVSGVPLVHPTYDQDAPKVNGSEVMNACFDAHFRRDPRIVAFGEDLGHLGDVNQGFAGLQAKYGELRITDTGIRECTILGQAIGLAMRGLRPIAEIQYLDYLLYALQVMSDDLATLQWRTKGGQKAPVIVRTRGHRLEGVWHSGSPMAGILNLVRGMYVCVPRNMTQAAGMYTTLLHSDEPGLIVEVLNGYRLKEPLPSNIGEYTVPLGVPEVLRPGTDLTLVTYGASCRVAMEAARDAAELGIDVEVIDVQTLLPFDTQGVVRASLQKTNRLMVLDEDVPGGASAFILQQVLEHQDGYRWLDARPTTVTAQEHRPAYGTDGNFWSKPEAEHVFTAVYDIMHEADPQRWPRL
jgi:pyruvate/2-oxoglutarate/acetoin dehydrogenase E1 component/TPP-dependent pyruvate/acetoin dehydrogenase alpha subunit